MLLVEQKVSSEEVVGIQKSFNIDDFIWPHGITPPLHHTRKRRFRRRVNRRTIESVEQEVERLLEQDAMAEDVKYGMFILVVDPARFSSDYPFQRSWTT
jgi:transcription initiation factor TFIID subunit 7